MVHGDVLAPAGRPDGRFQPRRWATALLGVVIGAASAFAELAFLLFAVPALALPAARPRVFAAAGVLAEFERRRIERYLGQPSSEHYTGRRALSYVAVRWLVGWLGTGVLLLIVYGAVGAPVTAWQVATGRALGDSGDPAGGNWYDAIILVLYGSLLVFLTLQGLLGVIRLDCGLARRLLGPTAQELLWRRVGELTVTQAEVVEAVNDERRRIERDLHDGVQQRVVALGMLLAEEGHQVAAAVGDAVALLTETDRHRPDVVLTDVRMPPNHTDEGLRAALEIRRRWPRVASWCAGPQQRRHRGCPVRLPQRGRETH